MSFHLSPFAEQAIVITGASSGILHSGWRNEAGGNRGGRSTINESFDGWTHFAQPWVWQAVSSANGFCMAKMRQTTLPFRHWTYPPE